MKFLHFLAVCLFAFGMSHAIADFTDFDFDSEILDFIEDVKLDCFIKPKTNGTSSVHKFEIVTSDSTIPKISKSFKFPYIPKNLKIGLHEYSVFNAMKIVNENREDILLTLQRNMREHGDTFWLNIQGKKEYQKFYSAINLKVNTGENTAIKDIDLLTLDEKTCPSDSVFNLLGIEFKLRMDDSVNVDLGAINKKSNVVTTIVYDFIFEQNDDRYSMRTVFNSFTLEFPALTPEDTKGWPLGIVGNNLTVNLKKGGVQTNVKLDEKIDDIYMPLNISVVDKIDIPFLDKGGFLVDGESFTLGKIFEDLDDYYKTVGYFVDDAIGDDLKIAFKDLSSAFKKFANKRVVVDTFAIINKPLLDASVRYDNKHFVNLKTPSRSDAGKKFQLKKGWNVLVYKMSLDSLKYSPKAYFDGFKADELDLEIVVYAMLFAYVTEDGWIILDDSYIDRIDFTFNADVPSLDMGLFNAKFGDGSPQKNAKLTYKMIFSLTKNDVDKILQSSLELNYDSLTVLAGNMVMETSKNLNKKERIRYDFENRKWILPNSLKYFSNFSSDDLLNHVYIALNSMRSVNGIAGTDVATKFEQLIFGDSLNNRRSEILKKENGKYIKSFADVSDFVRNYNYAWHVIFPDDKKKETDDACKLVFLDANKKEIVFKDGISKSKVAYAKITFRFDFNLRPDYRLEFVAALRNKLAELPSDAQVRVCADSSIALELLIKLK